MSNGPAGDELKRLWQGQATAPLTMTTKLIRSRARQLQSGTRRKLLGAVAGPVAVGLFFFFAMRVLPTLPHVLLPLYGVALVWSLAGLYFLNRGMWPAPIPEDAGLTTGLDFCRGEIERRRSLLSRVLFWSFAPLLLAIGTLVLALAMASTEERGVIPNGLPFVFLVAVWIAGFFVIRLRERRDLQRELSELDELAQENRRLGSGSVRA